MCARGRGLYATGVCVLLAGAAPWCACGKYIYIFKYIYIYRAAGGPYIYIYRAAGGPPRQAFHDAIYMCVCICVRGRGLYPTGVCAIRPGQRPGYIYIYF